MIKLIFQVNAAGTKPKVIDLEEQTTISELKTIIAREYDANKEMLQSIEISLGYMRKIIADNRQDKLTLSDLGVKDCTLIKINMAKNLNSGLENNQFQSVQKETLDAAKTGFTNALRNAQKEGANVVITVGSFVNVDHGDEDSVRRQQLPLKWLRNTTRKTHFIHIDEGFGKQSSKDQPAQIYEQEGWQLIGMDEIGLIRTYAKDNFTITTIAKNLQNEDEFQSYFENENRAATTIFGVDFVNEAKIALEEQRDFITGNFYGVHAKPVFDAQLYFSVDSEIKKHGLLEKSYSANKYGYFVQEKNEDRKSIVPEVSPKKGH